ncbi:MULTISPECIES: DUF2306 domain-containing protein [unclassified Leifsonia]|uniref:DUF2306 domain-containing protein n=1 Tax=unclassified Leifsonia TaxID=2663824 RepID=UPI0006F83683|nr:MULTISPECIES: DUF2306 domain-containing protein [unclassified Leifsonia]KQX05571.1 hypothetical protein ASC59_15870 [Leifsonia sp. Root1293]KRA09205.1 hypothetical protein ASD61_15865 [Leifsonia sp. Root60]
MTETIDTVATRPLPRRRPEWLAPTGLIALSLVPILAGSMRLSQLGSGAAVTAENARFFDSPVPVIVHIVSSSVFLVLGALQFAPSLRRRRWHRIAGRIVAPAGVLSALSALWMTLFYSMPANYGPILFVLRVVLAVAMVGAIVYAVLAIRRGDVRTHSAWMTRAYAIGLGAGTQVFVFLPWTLLLGEPDQLAYSLLMGAGWAINLAVAEVVIRRRALTGGGRARTFGRSTPLTTPLS